ncbi:uncharacterized protein LOC132731748 isoform X2 [Ruditapes philippinarum]|nr:uncharacterized protein LOC132731748 isoform X2 [Ruditapes philippinarum]
MTYLARSTFKQFFNSLNSNEKMSLETLLDIAQNRIKGFALTRVKDHRVWVVDLPECKSLLEKLVAAHLEPEYIGWENIRDTNVERYWKIAKLYMPHGNKDSTCPEDADMIAIFHMLRNFKVKDFAEERKEIVEMICHVNYLLRTPNNKVSERKMFSILENIYQFMKSTELSEGVRSMAKDKLEKVQLISNCDEWYKRILREQKSDRAFERDRTNQFLNITEKLLVEFTNKTRFTIARAYNEPLSDKTKDATAVSDIEAIGGPSSLLYGSTLGATSGGTSFVWKKSTVNPPSKSSDEEHKKSTQRRFLSPDSDEDLLEVHGISKEEEVNWVKSVLALKITADDAMTYLARSIFKQFFDSLNFNEKMNLDNLLDIAQNRHKDYKLTRGKYNRVWVVNSPECRSLLAKLVSAHWDPAYIEWENIGDVHMDSYWKIAKLYMPKGNKDSTCPEETNMLAIFHLLRNFKVKDFVEERIEIDQMIRHSNFLIFLSQENRISEKKMTEIFKNINKFLESKKLSDEIKSKTKDRLEKVQLMSNIGTWTWIWYKTVLPKQRKRLAVTLDRTEQFLNITQWLLLVLKLERRHAMIREKYHHVWYMFLYALVGALTGLVIGCVSGATIGALLRFFEWL